MKLVRIDELTWIDPYEVVSIQPISNPEYKHNTSVITFKNSNEIIINKSSNDIAKALGFDYED